MRRYERASTLLTSNRPVDDWGKLLGDTAAVTALLDRLLHHAHVLKCGPELAHQSADRFAYRRGNEVELTGLGRPEIAGFALSTNCRFSTVHRGRLLRVGFAKESRRAGAYSDRERGGKGG